MRDDLGVEVTVRAPRRVVSLVPSLTESVAEVAPELLVGATDWCTHPAGLDVARVGGSKYPRVADVRALRPDLVLANAEENRRQDVAELRAAGIAVWVTFPRTVAAALDSLERMFAALGVDRPPWMERARRAWRRPAGTTVRVAVPVWRRPWIWLGADTFATDVLRRLGAVNVVGGTDRYPRIPPAEASADAELLVLPDEPYRFTDDDGPETFAPLPSALVSGRHLTWYGPSLATAPEVLGAQLAPERWLRAE